MTHFTQVGHVGKLGSIRIAWPCVGLPMIRREPRREAEVLRREEIETLFASDLRARRQWPARDADC